MGKRKTPPHQRRMCPDHRRPEQKEDRPGKRAQPSRQELFTRSGEPVIREEASSTLFCNKGGTDNFAELVELSLTAPEVRNALLEKKLERQRRDTAADRLLSYPAAQEELDLHGFTGNEAAGRIENFILTAHGKGFRTVRVITGKGLHSEGPAVLSQVAEKKLHELKERGLLLAYSWERKKREHSGALIVYLLRGE
ncbi:MAG: Smr/MutS family protein [Desulfobulbaceae bacterium]|nr:Smr/MutS family protein [Desulfobulbaceae bacterium]